MSARRAKPARLSSSAELQEQTPASCEDPSAVPSPSLDKTFPLIVTPSHDGKLFDNYTLSLINLVGAAPSLGLRLNVFISSGESLITRARNNAVAHFLAHPEYTHLFWIDSDIGFSVEAVCRLLGSGHEVCGGVYPLKYEQWPDQGLPALADPSQLAALLTRYTVNTGAVAGQTVEIEVQPDGFIRLDEAPTGFMSIRRDVFERMIAAYPELRYTPDSPGVVDQGLHYRLFDCFVAPESGRYLSEDYAFCRLWSALGGSVFVDACSTLSHRGGKTYRGDFATALVSVLPNAVGAPGGTPMRLNGAEHLRPNPPGPM